MHGNDLPSQQRWQLYNLYLIAVCSRDCVHSRQQTLKHSWRDACFRLEFSWHSEVLFVILTDFQAEEHLQGQPFTKIGCNVTFYLSNEGEAILAASLSHSEPVCSLWLSAVIPLLKKKTKSLYDLCKRETEVRSTKPKLLRCASEFLGAAVTHHIVLHLLPLFRALVFVSQASSAENAVGRLVWKSGIISGWVSACRGSPRRADLSLYV